MTVFKHIANRPGRLTVAGAPEGFDALLLAEAARGRRGAVLHVARDDQRAQAVAAALAFFAPDIPAIHFPAWDCLPYDRLSPKPEIAAQRMAALAALASRDPAQKAPLVIIAPVQALVQRVPPRKAVTSGSFSAAVGSPVDAETLISFLTMNGYSRTSVVTEPGDFAVRGGLIDLFPPGSERPLRLDLFGETLDAIRPFEPDTQRTAGSLESLHLLAVSEAPLDPQSVHRFRAGYLAAFGAVMDEDPLYEAVSAGRKHQGMEHWLPLFHDRLETFFDYLEGAAATFDPQATDARDARLALITDYHDARAQAHASAKRGDGGGGPAYKPLPPDRLYLSSDEWETALAGRDLRQFVPFDAPESDSTIDAGGRPGRSFAPERANRGSGLFEAVTAHIKALQGGGKRVLLACGSEGAAERMGTLVSDHGIDAVARANSFSHTRGFDKRAVLAVVLPLEHGFEAEGLAVISEQDILGDRLVRARRSNRKAQEVLAEAASLTAGDLVVHVDHGIGRYEGLKTIDVMGAPHDCLELTYDGGKLFLPVENIELLSRYGSDAETVALDRLGGSGWQARKAKLKNRIREIAGELIRIAAERALKKAPNLASPQGLYDEFCARFPYDETDDQLKAISDALDDLSKPRPMDRLVCGDVGFGKTEVALRAAFVTAMSGLQVAVIAPTTLLARQHFKTFSQRFAGWPVNVRHLSRFVPAKEATQTKKDLAAGTVEIVVGTHALLAKSISFKNLGLLVIDEEQHFGVSHKERLKQLKSDVHVLTLTATPIPRTLQLALSGVRELSLIATPPVDRLAVRTFVGPFDGLTVREALLREHYRGGQSFFVVPRISDLQEASEFLKETVPEVKHVVAHGQMAAADLDEIMNAFYDGQYEVLISTTIVESGLDIPTANTMVIQRADMFGLAQLYQLRGRIGRSKQRAYAYLTTPPGKALTPNAEKRLKVLQSLDTLGAGFQLASHDLDIRGAGNLLGEEQSGHVREVGLELYQDMLEEAVAQLRSGGASKEADDAWSPQINLGAAVLIPEGYVSDLNVRLSLYRRLSELDSQADIEGFAAELIDRFGPLPDEVGTLLQVVAIKRLCRISGVEKIDAGPKGAIIAFRNNSFGNPAALVRFIQDSKGAVKPRPDQKLVVVRDWGDVSARLKGAHAVLAQLAGMAQAA